MLYIRLFHGRTDPDQDMDDWGSDGPVLGPYEFVHTTYAAFVRLGRRDGICDELHVLERDMLYYNGVYYGDWSVFPANIFEQEYKSSLQEYDELKAKLSKKNTNDKINTH